MSKVNLLDGRAVSPTKSTLSSSFIHPHVERHVVFVDLSAWIVRLLVLKDVFCFVTDDRGNAGLML